jgi:hypothetical protein
MCSILKGQLNLSKSRQNFQVDILAHPPLGRKTYFATRTFLALERSGALRGALAPLEKITPLPVGKPNG